MKSTSARLRFDGLETRITPVVLPAGFADTQLVAGLSSPTGMAIAPDGRIFVTQQTGQLRVVVGGVLQTAPVLSVTTDSTGERGLLGVAFNPSFTSNHFLYVYYTVPGAGAVAPFNRVSRFTLAGNVAVAGSEVALLNLDPLSTATNHNGGALNFGADGKLYVAVGENGTPSNSQTLNNRLGKLLRINSDGSIPTDNPFFATAVGANRSIWALGLRNPFSFAVQPGTGTLFINDVGQATYEEIDRGIAGANYGWPGSEGPTTAVGITAPIFSYRHDSGTPKGNAITGGTFYNPATNQFGSEYVGKYFFVDLVSNFIFAFDPAVGTATSFATSLANALPVGLSVDSAGNLLYLSRGFAPGAGTIHLISKSAGVSTASSTVTLIPSVPGIPLFVDGAPSTGSFSGAPGSPRTISAPVSTILNAQKYRFTAWSDGGAISHAVATPASSSTISATFARESTYAVATGPGVPATVRLIDAVNGETRRTFSPFGGFSGGVSVATGDFNGDGFDDLVVAAGKGGGPHVMVLDGLTGNVLRSFFAYDPAFGGGVEVATGDVTGDGVADIVVGVSGGGAPHVEVFDGVSGALVRSFFAFDPAFGGGVRIAVGDTDGDGFADLMIAAATGGGPHVRVISGRTGAELQSFFAFDPAYRGGISLGSGDIDGDGRADLLIGAGDVSAVRVLRGDNLRELQSFFAYSARVGVRVSAADIDGDGRAEIVTGASGRGAPHLKAFDGETLAERASEFAFDPGFLGGVYVGGSGRK